MRGQTLFVQKKRGRPAGRVRPPTTALRLENQLLERVDAWVATRPEPRPTRPEAIRRLVEKGLSADSVGNTDASLDRQIAEQEVTIAEMPEPAGPSPEAALATMDKALAKNDLIKLKNKRTRQKITRHKA